MPRLFSGIEIPEELQDTLSDLEMPLPGARWIEADDLHLTLRYAGDIDNARARDFADALAAIDHDVFDITIAGVGVFGGNDPRALWAGIEDSEALTNLARAHERAARAAGLDPEPRAFRPHVTLARMRNTRAEAVAHFLQRHGTFRLPPLTVERFVLFSSRPQVGGGPYGVVEIFPLRGASPAAHLFADEMEQDRWR